MRHRPMRKASPPLQLAPRAGRRECHRRGIRRHDMVQEELRMNDGQRMSVEELRESWRTSPRWKGIARPYSAEDVDRLRGTVHVEHSLARLGAEKLWRYLHELPF